MPTYQYACTECDNEFEQFQAFSDAALTVCTVCGGRLRKVYGSVGVVFKGSGFYRTDSRNGDGKVAKADAAKNGSEKSSKADGGTGSAGKSGDSAGSSGSGSAGSGSSSAGSSGSSGKDAGTSGSGSSGNGGSAGSGARAPAGATPAGSRAGS